MNKIIYPLNPGMQGIAVADLQDGLLLCLDRGVLLANDEGMRQELATLLQRERERQLYGEVTAKLVSVFQEEHRLQSNGEVDERTAAALNDILNELGAFNAPREIQRGVVAGQITQEDQIPFKGTVVLFHEGEQGSIRLGEDSTGADGRYTIRYEPLPGVSAINLRVAIMDGAAGIRQSSDLIRDARPLEIVNIVLPVAAKSDVTHGIKGLVLFDDGYIADGLRLRLCRRRISGDTDRLAETVTLTTGEYACAYKPDGQTGSLDIRALKHTEVSVFSEEDFENFVSLAAKLKNPADAVSRFLVKQFSEAVQQALTEWAGFEEMPASLQDGLIDELNKVIKGPSIWGKERFAHLELREEVQNMVTQVLQDEDLARFNRLLLEDAYPAELLEVPLSQPLIDLDEQAELNLIAPGRLRLLAPEFERLIQDLTPHIGDISKLAEIRENSERQDISLLNRATGWDARAIALASISEKLSKDPDLQLPSAAMYGLLRAGLPHDKTLLVQLEPEVVERALKTVRDAGIVALDDKVITATVQKFSDNRDQIRLNLAVPGSRTTYGALLRASNLDEEKQKKFARVFLNHRGSSEQLWKKATEDAELNSAQVHHLKLQGKLAFLSHYNERMTAALLARQLHTPEELIEKGFYKAEQWRGEIFTRAKIPLKYRDNLREEDKKKLENWLPPASEQETIEDRLDNYAEDMARKLRISYPSQVLIHRIENDDNFKPLINSSKGTELLQVAVEQGFRLGETPVDTFFDSRDEDFTAGISKDELNSAKQQIRTLHRLYQISTSDEAIPVLLAMGVSSAQEVAALNSPFFTAQYSEKYFQIHKKHPPQKEGEWIVKKSEQVSSIVYSLFTTARKMQSDFSIGGISASPEIRTNVVNSLVKQFPTMESLFGSMDYCECEHCNSVLSPAAYLVDLLQSLEEWGKPDRLPAGSGNPYEALIAKRPDIPYISLTCENTHTALPYIDVVNEILEYYVAGDGKLTEDAAHDTGKATTAELLAEPQNIITDAYNKLHDAHYPLSLPFDLWIETVRQFCNYFDTPLHQLLETLRTSDQLFAPEHMYDRAAIFMESMALSPEETSILTRADMLDKWGDLYGFTDASAAILDTGIETGGSAKFARLAIANDKAAQFAVGDRCGYVDSGTNALSNETKVIYSIGVPNSGSKGQVTIKLEGTWQQPPKPGDFLVLNTLITLTSAKQLARRLGITYKEITEIVLGGFVNPNLPSLGLLYKLGIGISDARLYKDHKDFYNQFRDLVDKERKDLQPADQQRFDTMSSQVTGTPFTGWHIVNELHALEQKLSVLKSPAVTLNELLTEIEHLPFDKVLVLADPDTGCDFDRTTLRYADGSDIKPVDLLRINLFVRLWRKLGWTIEEADRALSTFIPPEVRAGNDGAELAKWFKTALIYIAHLKTLADKLTIGKNSRIRLLILWGEMAITGESPLYAQLFLTPGVLKNDPVFDHPLGDYLSASWIRQTAESRSYRAELPVVEKDKIDPTIFTGEPLEFSYDLPRGVQSLKVAGVFDDNQKSAWLQKLPDSPVLEKLLDDLQQQGKEFVLIKGHLPALQGAMGLTAQEIEHILADNDRSIEEAELSLENVSLLYRYGLLAKGVRLPVSELITLKQVSGCNPFIEPHNPLFDAPLEFLDKDHLFSGTLAFVDLVEEIKSSGLSIEDIDYLLCHRFIEAGKYRPDSTATLTLLRTIADGVRAIRTEHAVPEDAGMITEEVLRQKLGLVFENDVVDRLMKMMDGTIESPETHRDFFNDYFCRRTVRIEDDAGFLNKDEFDSFSALLKKIEGDQEEQDAIIEQNQQTILGRHWQLARSFLPFLQRRLIRQFVVQTLQAHTQAEFNLTESLLTDERLLNKEAQPLLRIFESTGMSGLTVTFYNKVNFEDAFEPVQVCSDADTGSKIRRNGKLEAIKPDMAKSARFEGYLLVPNSGSYRFLIEPAAAAGSATPDVELHFLHLPQSRFLSTPVPGDGNTPGQATEFLDLKAGVFYRFRLDIRNLQGGNVRLRVQSETLPIGSVSRLELYPSESMDAAEHALLSLTKALSLVQGLGLNEREIRYLLTHADRFDGLNISALPIRNIQNPDGKLRDEVLEALHGCFTWFRRLVGYTRLKRELASGNDKLIDIFEVDEVTPADKRSSTDRTFARIAALTRRDSITVRSAAYALFQSDPAFSHIAFFVDERRLQRLWQTLQVVERFGVPAGELVNWTRIVNTTLSQEQRYRIARSIKETIKARYEPEAWQRVARPIFDMLRQRQRDALVAVIMHQHRFARIEQLYEYFLIDPGMEPVVQTSRIRLAIASVQLFIQRCLLNLEPGVLPSAIHSGHWEWMKRYRVWEANRKIFLFPENWLEPEFRDDKTHLFSELEGALLQDDVSSDMVEDAFLNYLKKLDELARLDIVAMHIEEDDADRTHRILHVFGRTFGGPGTYFYRRYDRQMWTPWEPVTAEITGDHLAPVVWRDRLYLFWVTFMDKPIPPEKKESVDKTRLANVEIGALMNTLTLTDSASKKKIDVQLHWSEYSGGTWSPAAASGFVEDILGAGSLKETHSFPLNFDLRSIFIHVSKEIRKDKSEGGVFVHLRGGGFNRSFYLESRNAAPFIHLSGTGTENGKLGETPANPFIGPLNQQATRYAGTGGGTSLKVEYRKEINNYANSKDDPVTETILGKTGSRFNILPCNNVLSGVPPAESVAGASEPATVQAAIEASFEEILSLMKPVFYQDTRHTLFIEPTVKETTVERWEDWVPAASPSDDSGFIVALNPTPISITPKPVVSFSSTFKVEKLLYPPTILYDPIINPITVLEFGEALLGAVGQVDLLKHVNMGIAEETEIVMNMNSESTLSYNSNLNLDNAEVLSRTRLQQSARGLNVVGRAGFTAELAQNLFSSAITNLTGFSSLKGVKS